MLSSRFITPPHPTPPPSMISASCKWFCLASRLNLSGDVSEARWIRKWCERRWVVPPATTCNSVLTNSTRVLICFILVLHGHLPDAKWDGGVWSHVGTGFAHVLVAYVALFSYSASNLIGHQTSLFDPSARGGAPNVEEHFIEQPTCSAHVNSGASEPAECRRALEQPTAHMLTAVHPSLRQLLQHRGCWIIHRLHHGWLCNTYRGSRSTNHTYEGTIFRIFSGEWIAIGALGWTVQKPGLACVPMRAPIFQRFNYAHMHTHIYMCVHVYRAARPVHFDIGSTDTILYILSSSKMFFSLKTRQRCKILDGTSTGFWLPRDRTWKMQLWHLELATATRRPVMFAVDSTNIARWLATTGRIGSRTMNPGKYWQILQVYADIFALNGADWICL